MSMPDEKTSPSFIPARPFAESDFSQVRRAIGREVLFAQGDVAIGYGAVLAGCRFFAGYPITPATETAEIMSRLMPKIGGTCIQMEDEIASIGAVIGASWAGAKAMTTTSGPGFSLMQENIGYAAMTETPCVIANVQRSGPSTGQPTEGAQGDIMQAKWGSHGDYELIALSPSTVQECLDFTIEAFNLSERYRVPVILLTDGIIGHTREKIVLPNWDDLHLVPRKQTRQSQQDYLPFIDDGSQIPEMANFGDGYHVYITGLTHVETGYPSTDNQPNHQKLVQRLCGKIRDNADEIVRVQTDYQDGDGESTGIISFGVTSRTVFHAVKELRASGERIDHLRIVTNWPFPEQQVTELSQRCKRLLVPELNLGQTYHVVREVARDSCEVVPLWKIGGEMHTPQEIIDCVRGAGA